MCVCLCWAKNAANTEYAFKRNTLSQCDQMRQKIIILRNKFQHKDQHTKIITFPKLAHSTPPYKRTVQRTQTHTLPDRAPYSCVQQEPFDLFVSLSLSISLFVSLDLVLCLLSAISKQASHSMRSNSTSNSTTQLNLSIRNEKWNTIIINQKTQYFVQFRFFFFDLFLFCCSRSALILLVFSFFSFVAWWCRQRELRSFSICRV